MIASLKRAFIPISLVTMVGGAFYLIAVYPSQNQQSYADLRKQIDEQNPEYSKRYMPKDPKQWSK